MQGKLSNSDQQITINRRLTNPLTTDSEQHMNDRMQETGQRGPHPLVSIIIPCYNQGRYLSDAVNCLATQSYNNWECVIVNDGSQDNTLSIANELAQKEPRLKVVNQNNKGLSGARNSGLSAANGEVFQFLDADDLLEKNKLQEQVEFLLEHPGVGIVFSDARYFTTEDPGLRSVGPYTLEKSKPWIPSLWERKTPLIEKSLSHNLFPVNCPLVRKEVFDKVGNWNEDLAAHEDWEFWIRCAIADIKMEFLDAPDTLALIRMHSESMTHDTERMNKSIFQMRVLLGPLLKDPSERLFNFKRGLHSLQAIGKERNIFLLFKLIKSNFSNKTLLAALSYYISKTHFLNAIPVLYKKVTPWPIQKTLSRSRRPMKEPNNKEKD